MEDARMEWRYLEALNDSVDVRDDFSKHDMKKLTSYLTGFLLFSALDKKREQHNKQIKAKESK